MNAPRQPTRLPLEPHVATSACLVQLEPALLAKQALTNVPSVKLERMLWLTQQNVQSVSKEGILPRFMRRTSARARYANPGNIQMPKARRCVNLAPKAQASFLEPEAQGNVDNVRLASLQMAQAKAACRVPQGQAPTLVSPETTSFHVACARLGSFRMEQEHRAQNAAQTPTLLQGPPNVEAALRVEPLRQGQ